MTTGSTLPAYVIASGEVSGYEVKRFIDARTAQSNQSVSHLVLSARFQEAGFFEREIRARMIHDLAQVIAQRRIRSSDTGFSKTFTMQAVVLDPEELYALMEWAKKQPKE